MTFFDGFYQLGFVARDLERALAGLGERYGVARFRRKRLNETMSSAHAYVGDLMLEVIEVSDAGPAIFREHLPADVDAVRLHHHGFRVADGARWRQVVEAIEARGLATSMRGEAMEGDLKFLYADTRRELGVYSEFVLLRGAALAMYDDVPRN